MARPRAAAVATIKRRRSNAERAFRVRIVEISSIGGETQRPIEINDSRRITRLQHVRAIGMPEELPCVKGGCFPWSVSGFRREGARRGSVVVSGLVC